MKRYTYIFFAILLAFAGSVMMTACFQNDGYIGVYFGSWVFEDITVDGEPVRNPVNDEEYNHHLCISFQSSFFELAMGGGGQKIQGIWKENDGEITLHGAEETATDKDPATGEGIFPWQMGFGTSLIETLKIEKKTKKRMVWTRVDSEGRLWRYELRHLL